MEYGKEAQRTVKQRRQRWHRRQRRMAAVAVVRESELREFSDLKECKMNYLSEFGVFILEVFRVGR